jgi:Family of unknown function (DUF6665)
MRKPLADIEKEIAAERAASLGIAGRHLRSTLAALKRFDAEAGPGATRKDDWKRTRLLEKAAEACHAYIVQRELLGFGRDDAELIRREYDVPAQVWKRLGAVPDS